MISDRDKLKCLEREIALRRSVYPTLIDKGRLKPDTAAYEIEVMAAIAEDYRARIRDDEGLNPR